MKYLLRNFLSSAYESLVVYFLTCMVSLFCSILLLTCSAVDFFFSKVKIIFNVKLDAKKGSFFR